MNKAALTVHERIHEKQEAALALKAATAEAATEAAKEAARVDGIENLETRMLPISFNLRPPEENKAQPAAAPNEDGVMKFYCPHCPQTFTKTSSLKWHVECHVPSEQRQLKCELCTYYAKNSTGLSHHMHCHIPERPTSSMGSEATEIYENVGEMYESIEEDEQGEENNTPPPPPEEEEDRSVMVAKIKEENQRQSESPSRSLKKQGTGQFMCEICPQRFSQAANINRHMKGHQPGPDRTLKCDFCPYYAANGKSLTRHVKCHFLPANAGENLDVTMENDENEGSHARDVSPNKSRRVFPCEICPQICTFKSNLKTHMLGHTPTPERPIKCDLCPFWAPNKGGITSHAKCHDPNYTPLLDSSDNTEPSSGTESSESSSGKKTLPLQSYAIPMETDESDPGTSTDTAFYACEECPQKLTTLKGWKYHMEGHKFNPDRALKCGHCSYHAPNKQGLSLHLKCHVEEAQELIDQERKEASGLINIPGQANVGIKQERQSRENTPKPIENTPKPRENIPAIPISIGLPPKRKSLLVEKAATFACELCPQKLAITSLYYHTKLHKPAPNRPFKCKYCPYYVGKISSLVAHQKYHPEELGQNDETIFENIKQEKEETPKVETRSETPTRLKNIADVVKVEKVEEEEIAKSEKAEVVRSERAVTRSRSPSLHSEAASTRSQSPLTRSQSPLTRSQSPLMRSQSPLTRSQSPSTRMLSPASRSRSTSVSSRADEKQESQTKSPATRSRSSSLASRGEERQENQTRSPRGPVLYSKVSEFGMSEIGSPVKERKIFSCNICPYKTIEGTNINRHVKAHQPRPGANNVCDYCPFYARSSGAVKNHERVHFKADDVDERILVKGYNPEEMAKDNICGNDEEEEEEDEQGNVEEESSDEESDEEEVGLYF